MDYEYYVDKDRENRRKHGLPLILGRAVIESMLAKRSIWIRAMKSVG